MASGAGLYWVAVAESALLLILQTFLHKHQTGSDMLTEQEVSIVLSTEDRDDFNRLIDMHECLIDKSKIEKNADLIRMVLYVRAKTPVTYEETIDFIHDHPSVTEFNVDTM